MFTFKQYIDVYYPIGIMITIRGVFDMLKMADESGPKSFNDFTTISINKKRLSSATVSKRLEQLIRIKVIEEVVTRSKTGRRIIGYKTTEKGKRVIVLIKELEEIFAGN